MELLFPGSVVDFIDGIHFAENRVEQNRGEIVGIRSHIDRVAGVLVVQFGKRSDFRCGIGIAGEVVVTGGVIKNIKEMNTKFILNESANPNYLATICKIEDVYPIEGADKLGKTVINGYDIVISKDHKPGDIVVYFPVESSICEKYLSANNLYCKSRTSRGCPAFSALFTKRKRRFVKDLPLGFI